MYIETSSPRRLGDVAMLASSYTYEADGQDKCLTFWLHMYGTTMGSLAVLQGDSANQKQLFRIPGI